MTAVAAAVGARAPAAVGAGAINTSDLVQDTLHHTFARIGGFKSKQASALRAYLRRGVENRIRDQMRGAIRRRDSIAPDERILLSEEGAPQLLQVRQVPLVAVPSIGQHRARTPAWRPGDWFPARYQSS